MTEQICRVCRSPIRTMCFRNTGACCERHLDLLERHPDSVIAPGGWCAPADTSFPIYLDDIPSIPPT